MPEKYFITPKDIAILKPEMSRSAEIFNKHVLQVTTFVQDVFEKSKNDVYRRKDGTEILSLADMILTRQQVGDSTGITIRPLLKTEESTPFSQETYSLGPREGRTLYMSLNPQSVHVGLLDRKMSQGLSRYTNFTQGSASRIEVSLSPFDTHVLYSQAGRDFYTGQTDILYAFPDDPHFLSLEERMRLLKVSVPGDIGILSPLLPFFQISVYPKAYPKGIGLRWEHFEATHAKGLRDYFDKTLAYGILPSHVIQDVAKSFDEIDAWINISPNSQYYLDKLYFFIDTLPMPLRVR